MLQRSDLLQDSPSKRIGQFLIEHKAAAGDLYLDVDLEMDELRNDRNHNNNNNPNPNPNPAASHRLPPLKPYDDRSKSHRVNPPPPREPNPNFNCIFPDEEEKFGNEIHEPPAACSCSSSDDDHHHDDNHTTMNRRRSMKSTASNDTSSSSEGQVLKCTSIQRKYSGLGRLKTRSRLLDPPETHKSGQLRPEPLGRSQVIVSRQEEDEEDPLFDEDLPDEYKNKSKFNTFIFLEWISLILIITAIVCTNTIAKWKIKKFRGLNLWKWEVLVLILICGRLVSGMGIRIVVFFIERNFLMRKRVLYFVYGVKRSVNNCIWLGMVWIAWHSMFAKALQGNDEFLWYVNKSLLCMIVGTLLWLVKTLMVKILASSFHVSTFFDRIQESLFTQYVIETLLGQPRVEIQRLQEEEEERTMAEFRRLQNAGAKGGAPPKKGASFRFCHSDSGINIDNLNKMNAKNVSAWRMKRLMKVVKKGLLTTLDERVQHSSEGDEAATQIRSEFEAKCAARKIFRNVAQPKSKFIYLEDLMRFLQEQEALKTMSAVEDSTESGRINKASLKTWVVNAFIERRALALTLNDTKTAVNKLHQMVNVLVGLIILIVCLVFLEIATSKFLLYISSQIFVVVFIFGNTCKTIFEAIIFVFVMHPFDVGDRCEIDGVQMIVEEMNILTTVFLRFDNLKIIYPNVTLATRYIGNFYRSPDMGDSVDFLVHITTPPEKIALIKQKFANYIESKPEHWYPQPSVVLMNIEQLHMMKLSVWMRHKMNFQNMGDRWKRRALLVEEMVKILKENDIEHRLYPLDVNIRSMPQISSSRVPHGWSIPPLAS